MGGRLTVAHHTAVGRVVGVVVAVVVDRRAPDRVGIDVAAIPAVCASLGGAGEGRHCGEDSRMLWGMVGGMG